MNVQYKINQILLTLLIFSVSITIYPQTHPNGILLNEYRPKSIYNIPVNIPSKSKFSVIDVHSHPYATTDVEIKKWISTMDEVGIEKTILLTHAHGSEFDSIYSMYSDYLNRFDLWCGIDYTGYDKPDYGAEAVAELERCFKKGAGGVGELGDKGKGLIYCDPPAVGMHIDDSRMDVLIEKCSELGMPINIHVGEPQWFYEPMDSTNDGLMNAFDWRLDNQKDILNLDEVVQTLENAVAKHPTAIFIACHLANYNHDLKKLGKLLEKYPNLYADIAARYAENAPVPRYTSAFITQYQDKLLYGTDMGFEKSMYEVTFRILETADEHFYEIELFNYHWPLYGLNLNDEVLVKLYSGNAQRLLYNR